MNDLNLKGLGALALLTVAFISSLLWGVPQYGVYNSRLEGMAKLAEAESSRQVLTAEAHAKMESAKLLAQAEVERARGVAEANQIIGKSLEGNESYLRYLWIQSLQEGKNEVIYVPTEAGLPILEAGRWGEQRKREAAADAGP